MVVYFSNIGPILQSYFTIPSIRNGLDLNTIHTIENACLAIENDKNLDLGLMKVWD